MHIRKVFSSLITLSGDGNTVYVMISLMQLYSPWREKWQNIYIYCLNEFTMLDNAAKFLFQNINSQHLKNRRGSICRDEWQTHLKNSTWLLKERSYSHSTVRVSNVCLKSSPLFSMWLAATDSCGPTRSSHICWRIYDQVVLDLCPSLGNTTAVLLIEEILYLITSAGAQLVAWNSPKQSGRQSDLSQNTSMMVQCFGMANTIFTLNI